MAYCLMVAAEERSIAVGRLVATTPLGPELAARVVDDLIELLGETVEQYVERRHGELQREGLRNDEIFGLLAEECAGWRFRAPSLSSRQLRRIVYG
jgi:hypothetical protein